MDRATWRRAKRLGFSDAQLAYLWDVPEQRCGRSARRRVWCPPTRPSTHVPRSSRRRRRTTTEPGEDTSEVAASSRRKVVILGSGPNRIGQGIEFDYCCVHACFALAEAGYETVMLNCNPETVSTDYDTSDRLYFEPLTEEDVLAVIDAERRSADEGGGSLAGVIVSLGGQTPLKLADSLPSELVLGTPAASIDAAEDRDIWASLCARLEIPQPAGGTATTIAEARAVVERIGYPALVRPSYVLGGRAMEIVYGDADLERAWGAIASEGSLGREGGLSANRPVLIDRFLEDATEVDVDAIADRSGEVLIGGIMEHVEEAGVHSGDSACVTPPVGLSAATVSVLEDYTRRIAAELKVCGLLNVQFAVKRPAGDDAGGQVFVIEANPRASRTVPFIAKATGVPLAKVAARVMCGATLEELRADGVLAEPTGGDHVAVKEAVLPWSRFPDVDSVLGPEMRSTGEVMGIDTSMPLAFVKSQLAAVTPCPGEGTAFFSLADRDKPTGAEAARLLAESGFGIVATSGTADYLRRHGVAVDQEVAKVTDDVPGDGADSGSRRGGPDRKWSCADRGQQPQRPWSARGRSPSQACRWGGEGAARDHCGSSIGGSPRHRRAALAGSAGAFASVVPRPSRHHDHSAGHRLWGGALRRRSVGSPTSGTSAFDPTTRVGSVVLSNAVMTASGTSGHGTELGRHMDLSSLGAVVVKSMMVEPWPGNPAPRLHPVTAGMLNSVGLQGDGIGHWLEHHLPELISVGATVVASIWGRHVEDYAAAAEMLAGAGPAVAAIEINLSCPNLDGGRHLFAHDPDAAARVVAATATAGIPRWAKLLGQHRQGR
ncbi:MAG: carbamoyl-phosphate synthase large subunit [Microthrixaceae bacterium]|nr:carbamoyl-phosphate synthase large subunit [Microthrixaceae bacterium]